MGAVPFPSSLEQQLARGLAERVAINEPVVRLTNSGSEAVALAVQTACAVTGRRFVLRFDGCYHGLLLPASSTAAWPGSQDYLTATFNDPASVHAVFAAHGRDLACVLIDLCPTRAALARAGGEFLAVVVAECQQYQSLVIIDEVISSRVASKGLASVVGISPDIVCLGKHIGGGMPGGAVVLRSEYGRLYQPGAQPRVAHSGTFNGNPLTTAAGVAALTHFGPADISRLNQLTDRFRVRLEEVLVRRRADWSVRTAGSLFCLWPAKNLPAAPPREHCETKRRIVADLSSFLLQRGVIVAPSGLGCLSTATQPEDLDYLLLAVDHYLSQERR
jgi:glutamate-1-semialdehyde 2,1-aminomutase